MSRKSIVGLLVTVFALSACQPQVVYVEVTPTGNPVEGEASLPATAPVVEVTRLVPEVVTQPPSKIVEEVTVEVTRPAPGSAERPIQLLFTPTVGTTVVTSRGEVLARSLAAATGHAYEVGILDDERSLIDLMCAAPADTVGFLSAMGYVLANQRCGVQAANVAVHTDELSRQIGMLVTRRDSGISGLADLEGKRWGVPDTTSLPESLYFQAMLAEAGVEAGEIVPVSGDTSAMLAVYNGEVDFATATFLPPILPYQERLWQYGVDEPELWRLLGVAPTRSPLGYVLVMAEPEFGGYRLRDARAGVIDIAPDIFSQTQILTLSAPIPNETVALGAGFPLALARQVIEHLADFASSESCSRSLCSTDFYDWRGLEPVGDDAYQPLRFLIQTLELSEADILTPAQPAAIR